MKKYLSIFLISVITILSVSCRNSLEKNSTKVNDSIQEESSIIPDLSLFQLKGPVKKCIISRDSVRDIIYEFNEDGGLTSPKYEKIERDKNGAIIEYYDPETEFTTRIKWEDGKVIGKTDIYGDIYGDINNSVFVRYGYEYDKENNIVQRAIESISSPTLYSNYSNYKFDEFGNWISRMVESNGYSSEEKRHITYYNSEVEQDSLEYYIQKKGRRNSVASRAIRRRTKNCRKRSWIFI